MSRYMQQLDYRVYQQQDSSSVSQSWTSATAGETGNGATLSTPCRQPILSDENDQPSTSACFFSHGDAAINWSPIDILTHDTPAPPSILGPYGTAAGFQISNSSASLTSSQQKVARQKQVANGASQPLLRKPSTLNAKPAPKPISAQKQPIPRLLFHPKAKTALSCPDCSITLRGSHELERHWGNVHAPVKRVWICVQSDRSPFQPKISLDICKKCKQGKQYNVYYNAAAHLRRAHFYPSKSGRRPRGGIGTPTVVQSTEKSRGSSVKDLKTYGWLREITVPNRRPQRKANCMQAMHRR